MIFFVSVGELTLHSNIHVHVLDCITNALNLCHIAIFPALPNYIMICRHCITTGKSWWAFKKFTATFIKSIIRLKSHMTVWFPCSVWMNEQHKHTRTWHEWSVDKLCTGITMDFRKIAEGVADRLQKYYKTAEGWTSAKKSVSFPCTCSTHCIVFVQNNNGVRYDQVDSFKVLLNAVWTISKWAI